MPCTSAVECACTGCGSPALKRAGDTEREGTQVAGGLNMNICVAKTGDICRSLHSCGDFFSGKTAGVVCRAGDGNMVSPTAS